MIKKIEIAVPDSMARSTSDARDSDLRISLSNRDAVVASTNKGLRKINARASLNVDAISVGTVFWGRNLDLATFEIIAFYESYVKELAIHWSYASNNRLVHCNKLQILKKENVNHY